MRECSLVGCHRKHRAKDLCNYHYNKLRAANDKTDKPICGIDNCDNLSICKGLCAKHYTRLLRHGNTGVNHHRKYRSTVINLDNILRPNMTYFSTTDEREVIGEMFKEYTPE